MLPSPSNGLRRLQTRGRSRPRLRRPPPPHVPDEGAHGQQPGQVGEAKPKPEIARNVFKGKVCACVCFLKKQIPTHFHCRRVLLRAMLQFLDKPSLDLRSSAHCRSCCRECRGIGDLARAVTSPLFLMCQKSSLKRPISFKLVGTNCAWRNCLSSSIRRCSAVLVQSRIRDIVKFTGRRWSSMFSKICFFTKENFELKDSAKGNKYSTYLGNSDSFFSRIEAFLSTTSQV